MHVLKFDMTGSFEIFFDFWEEQNKALIVDGRKKNN